MSSYIKIYNTCINLDHVKDFRPLRLDDNDEDFTPEKPYVVIAYYDPGKVNLLTEEPVSRVDAYELVDKIWDTIKEEC